MAQNNQLLVYSLCYILFFAMLLVGKRLRGNRLFDEQGVVANRIMLLLLHITGIVIFGIVAISFSGAGFREIVFGKKSHGDLAVLVLVSFVIMAMILGIIAAERKFGMMKLNKAGNSSFNPGFITNYFIVRVLFLLAYEMWFRGYLLITCINNTGTFIAIVINTALYVLLHCVNGKEEMWGCVPLGVVLCLLCIWTGAAWPAIVIHLALAISYEAHLVNKINKHQILLYENTSDRRIRIRRQ